jgi:branched-chain amino acid transport system substrate-binding protein
MKKKKKRTGLTSKMTRRRFIKTVGVGVGAAALPTGFYPLVYAREEPIVIGGALDFTGSLASWGYWHSMAAEKAVEAINKEGGIAGRPVKYVTEDTESTTKVGPRKFRKLVQEHNADFVLGSQHSAICIATNPYAKELKTPYLPTGMAGEITTTKGNRWVFRLSTHAIMQAEFGYKWAMENLGKKWSFVVSSMAWGQSHLHEWSSRVKAAGGKSLTEITIPFGTDDFTPYLVKVPKDTEVLINIFWTSEEIKFLQQSYGLGLAKLPRFTVICTIDAISTKEFRDAVSGSYFMEYIPRYMDQIPDDIADVNRRWRKLFGINDDGDEVGNTGRTSLGSHGWIHWSHVHFLKYAIEQSGWKSKKDNEKLLEFVGSGVKLKKGWEYPVGDIVIRPQDMQGFHDHYISKCDKNGKLVLVKRLDKELGMFDLKGMDRRKEAF